MFFPLLYRRCFRGGGRPQQDGDRILESILLGMVEAAGRKEAAVASEMACDQLLRRSGFDSLTVQEL